MNWNNYKCDGQMSLFDFLEKPEVEPGGGVVHRYLRYGPHTLVPEVRENIKAYLEKHGVPDWVKWDKKSLPCVNCTWFDGKNCQAGNHTCHFEFEYLICDMFRKSITERKPNTVGDVFPSLPNCEFSGHTCNKSELWRVADTLDDIECPHTCCRQCKVTLCGARCNGSEEPKPKCGLEKECEAYPDACAGTIQECRFGGPFKWSVERIGKK